MTPDTVVDVAAKRGAEDSGKYFKYIGEFIGLTKADAETIKQTKPIIEKHLPEIVAKFYSHLLRYPPTRKYFLKKDGSIDQDYVELRMRHLTNFWLRTVDAAYDDDYARYVDYVGRAHTSHGADPSIYIAERYVIGQVGFMQHAITEALSKELRHIDEDQEVRAVEAWDKLMMVILEMLSRAYGTEREAETFDPLVQVDAATVDHLAEEAFEHEHGDDKPKRHKTIVAARVEDIPDGERKIVQVEHLSIGIFHRADNWYAMRNSCLHRGGPVATGTLEECTLTCPWHGFQYDITDGHLLVDPNAKLEMYPVTIRGDGVELLIPDLETVETAATLKSNEFRVRELAPGQTKLVQLGEADIAVYNVDGHYYATQNACTHQGGFLSEGTLKGTVITCPIHGSCFDVTNGKVTRGPAHKPLETFRVVVDGDLGRVEGNS